MEMIKDELYERKRFHIIHLRWSNKESVNENADDIDTIKNANANALTSLNKCTFLQ